MYATNYLESMVLGALRKNTVQAPEGVYLALFSENPGEQGDVTGEMAYAGYARRPIVFSAPAPGAHGMEIQNTQDIVFAAADEDAGTVTHLGVMNASTGGSMLLYGPLEEATAVRKDDAPAILAGDARWWMQGDMTEGFCAKVLGLFCGESIAGFTPYLALYDGNPQDGGAELSGGGYARAALSFSAPKEAEDGRMQTQNAKGVSMGRAETDWGMWRYTAVCDAQTGGSVTFAAAREEKDMRAGTLVTVAEGALTLSIH